MADKDVFGMDQSEMEGLGFTDGSPDWPEHDYETNREFFFEEIL